MDNHEEERNELAEDEEKLQLALQEVADENEEWYDYDDVDDEDDDEGLLIDLDAPSSSTTGLSSSGYVESGSRGHFMTIDEDSQEGTGAPSINVPSQEKSESFSTEKTLALNQALQEILESRIESVQAALEINKEKQRRLNEGAWAELENKKPGKGRTWGPFRSPFFKSNEADSYPPDNEDTVLKRKNHELHYDSMTEHMHYNTTTKSTLLHALVEDTKELMMKPVMNRLEVELKKARELRKWTDEKGDDVQVLQAKWKSLRHTQAEMLEKKHTPGDELMENYEEMEDNKKEMAAEEEEYNRRLKLKQQQDAKVTVIEDELQQIKGMSDKEILCHVDSEKVDWMKVSKLWFKDSISWLDCQKGWDFMANPKINLKPWKMEEETRLLQLVDQHGAREWDAVAQELGTCRTPFHCFYHYQNRFNPEFKSRAWKKEEDAKLVEAVKRVRETSHVFTWGKVSALINSRSTRECSQRYSRIGHDRNFGRWSNAEDSRLLMAVETVGPDWRKVAKFMGNRTMSQCRHRYFRSLNPELNFFHFTYDDDRKLLQLYKELGRQWTKISSHFKGRTDTMVKSRFNTLQKWKRESDWWDNLEDYNKNLLLGKNLTVSERKVFEGEWRDFYNLKLGLADKDYRRQLKDMEKGLDPETIPPRPPIHLKYSKFQRSFANRKHVLWSKRLDQHHQLLETLKRRFEEETALEDAVKSSGVKVDKTMAAIKNILKNNQLRDEDLTDEELKLKEVMSSTLAEMKACQNEKREIPADRMNQIQSALNLHFLGDSNIFVRDILRSVETEKLAKMRAVAGHKKRINMRIQRILAKNKWVYARSSRCKGRIPNLRVIPVDTKASVEDDKAGKAWDQYVPNLLLRRLGGDPTTLMKSVTDRIKKGDRQKGKLHDFEEDSRYKSQVAALQRRIREVHNLWHLPKEERDKLEKKHTRKIKTIKREFAQAYTLKQEVLRGIVETGNKDVEYIASSEKNNPYNVEDADFPTQPSTSSCPQPCPSIVRSTAQEMLGDLVEVQPGNDNEDVTYGSINFLPPCLATMTGLRALLLHRYQLIKTAGTLYNPDHYKRKRKRQLHIILECENDDDDDQDKDSVMEAVDDEGDGVEAKGMKMDNQATIQAIQLVEGGDDVDTAETTGTDSWFKPQGNSSAEEVSWVDRDLERRGHLPSTSFAPYGSMKLKHRKREIANMRKLSLATEVMMGKGEKRDETDIPEWLPRSREGPKLLSNYEVMYGPSVGNINTYSKIPAFKLTKSMQDVEEEEEGDTGPVLESPSGDALEDARVDPDCENTELEKADQWKTSETVKVLKTLKDSDKDLSNVVVVSLSQDKNEIVHVDASCVKSSCPDLDNSNSALGGYSSSQKGDNAQKKEVGPQAAQPKQGPAIIKLTPVPAPAAVDARHEMVAYVKQKKAPDSWEVQKMAADMPHLVNRAIDRATRSAEAQNVVVVGVDPNSGKVTHYSKDNKAKVPAVSCQPHPAWPKKPEYYTDAEVKTCMTKVRETDEYQRLLARFRALFMWPVLISTTKPGSEVSLDNVHIPSQDLSSAPPKRPRGRPRKVPIVEEQKPEPKKNKEKPANYQPVPKPRKDYSKLLPKSEKPQRRTKTPQYHRYPDIRVKVKEVNPRIKKKAMLPDWWKEAIAEGMKKKQEIDDGKDDNYVVDISGDEDFVDKGEYSDDEWLAELREEERMKEERMKGKEEGETAEGMKRKKMTEGESREQKRQKTDDGDDDDDDDGVGGVVDDRVGESHESGGGGGGSGREGSHGDEGVSVTMNEDGFTAYITGQDGEAEEVRLEVMD